MPCQTRPFSTFWRRKKKKKYTIIDLRILNKILRSIQTAICIAKCLLFKIFSYYDNVNIYLNSAKGWIKKSSFFIVHIILLDSSHYMFSLIKHDNIGIHGILCLCYILDSTRLVSTLVYFREYNIPAFHSSFMYCCSREAY